MREWISGRNPVYETLVAGRRDYFRLLLAQGAQEKRRLNEIIELCQSLRVPIERVPRQRLDVLGESHQGVALEVSRYVYSNLLDIFHLAEKRGDPPFILILDALQDPQNMGSLLRTAECVGVHGVLLPLRQTVTITPAVVSSSAGACEHLLIAQENLAMAMKALKDAGLWIVGFENSPSAQPLGKVRLDGPLALVIGSEGQGMRSLTRKSCDWLIKLPMRGQINSLNAAVAGSVALYFIRQARGF